MDIHEIKNKLTVHTPSILGNESFGKFAVILPLIKKEDGIHVLFEERAYTLKRQPGDICFPGGRVEAGDKDETDTAIRETMEELGLKREDIGELHPLDYVITPFGTIIYPFVGFLHHTDEVDINKSEVESVFTVPLSFFINQEPDMYYINYNVEPEEGFPLDLIVGGKDYQWGPRKIHEYFYRYEQRVIWGMTAKILTHFIDKFCR